MINRLRAWLDSPSVCITLGLTGLMLSLKLLTDTGTQLAEHAGGLSSEVNWLTSRLDGLSARRDRILADIASSSRELVALRAELAAGDAAAADVSRIVRGEPVGLDTDDDTPEVPPARVPSPAS